MTCNITTLNKTIHLHSLFLHDFLFICKKVQELESERCAQQGEQESLLSAICKSLKEEHQAELRRLQRHMAQVQENICRHIKACGVVEKLTCCDLWLIGESEDCAAA